MGHSTDVVNVNHARKPHVCDWCGERIEQSQPYRRWRWFADGDACTVRVHPECQTALYEWSAEYGETEFMPGNNPRGCNCGFERGCVRCAEFNAARVAATEAKPNDHENGFD